MSTIYQKFKKLPLNFYALGLEQLPTTSDYFCTPKGAKLIGWAGVDGIHYCFLKDFGEMVFAVSPCNLPGDYVHPLAKNFEDFLRLMLACNGLDAMEQANGWGKDIFEEYLVENPVTEALAEQFTVIRESLGITPMEQPFEYIKKIQAEFDYSKLKFKKEYKEYVPEEYWPEKESIRKHKEQEAEVNGAAMDADFAMEAVCMTEQSEQEEDAGRNAWKVYFNGGFWRHHGKDKPGEKMVINKQFTWNGNVWHIPAVYACGKGLVVDFCIEIEREKIKEFLKKIEQYGDREDLWSEEIREEIHRENPTEIEFSAEAVVNGTVLSMRRGCGLGWMPEGLLETETAWRAEPEAEQILEHYGLDKQLGWSFRRVSFPWATTRKPAIKTMQVTMKSRMVPVVAKRFATPKPLEQVQITHPATGESYILTVQEITDQQLDMKPQEAPHWEELELPTYYKQMVYDLSPELPQEALRIQDCVKSDAPRQKPKAAELSGGHGSGAASVAIIGGADGPTAIFLAAGGGSKQPRCDCSALHFEPVEDVTWKAVFQEKPCEDESFDLL